MKILLQLRRVLGVAWRWIKEFWIRSPLSPDAPLTNKQGYFLVDLAMTLIWIFQMVSPALWLGALFSHKGKDGRYHQNPFFIDAYIIAAFILAPIFLLVSSESKYGIFFCIISSVIILEIVQYHLYLVFFRPYVDKTYRQYSGMRTILNTFISYISIINHFAVIYFHLYAANFTPKLTSWSAWTFSVGEISGSGYSAVTLHSVPGPSIVSGVEKIIGIFFLAIIIALALNRLNMPEIGRNFRGYDPDEVSKGDD